jgi:hypothetical protein
MKGVSGPGMVQRVLEMSIGYWKGLRGPERVQRVLADLINILNILITD